MKVSLASIITLAATTNGVSASNLRGDLQLVRHLAGDFAFLVTRNEWCISAVDGVGGFKNLGLEKCDFDNAPDRQLWRIDGVGKLASKLDTSQCMIANDGVDVIDNNLVSTASCDLNTAFNKFVWDAGKSNQLRLRFEQSLCVTHRGPQPGEGDDIRVKICRNEPRYVWQYTPLVSYFQLKSSSYKGCIEPRKGKVTNDNSLVLGDCNKDILWKLDSDGLLRSSLNEDKCLQVARGGTIQDGSKMRIFTCDKNEDAQKFDFTSGGRLTLKSKKDMCVVFRGIKPSINSDPIIIKKCKVIDPSNRLNWDAVQV